MSRLNLFLFVPVKRVVTVTIDGGAVAGRGERSRTVSEARVPRCDLSAPGSETRVTLSLRRVVSSCPNCSLGRCARVTEKFVVFTLDSSLIV